MGEAAGLRWEQVDLAAASLHVNRLKNGTRAVHPLYGDELRALRQLQKDYPNAPFIFMSSRPSPLAPDSIRGIIEQAGQLAALPFPIHATCCAMPVDIIWHDKKRTPEQFRDI